MEELINVKLNKQEIINLIIGTGGPGEYIHPFDYLGKLEGFPNEKWVWNMQELNSYAATRLAGIYQELKYFKENR